MQTSVFENTLNFPFQVRFNLFLFFFFVSFSSGSFSYNYSMFGRDSFLR